MNLFIMTGRIVADPEIRYTNDGKAIGRFRFAVNRTYKREGEADADFFQCTVFGKTAENFEKLNIGKGTKLLLRGEFRNNDYTDRDGVKHYGFQAVVNEFEFCESKGSHSGSTASDTASSPAAAEWLNVPDSFENDGLPFM